MELHPANTLNHHDTARRILTVLGRVVLFFFIHHLLRARPSFVAMSAAAVALMRVKPDIQELMKKVE